MAAGGVTELYEQLGSPLDERCGTADEDARAVEGRGSDRSQHLRVDPPCESRPIEGWIPREREVHSQPVVRCQLRELAAVQHVVG
jgi:hypothetical protein